MKAAKIQPHEAYRGYRREANGAQPRRGSTPARKAKSAAASIGPRIRSRKSIAALRLKAPEHGGPCLRSPLDVHQAAPSRPLTSNPSACTSISTSAPL